MERTSHWNQVYETKQPDAVSWYQPSPERSMIYIRKFADTTQRIIDIGAGAAFLVDALLAEGYEQLVALDVSSKGFDHAKARLGLRSCLVKWVVADVTLNPDLPSVDLWHDRAALHFLTDAPDQAAYADLAARTVRSGGHLVLGAFAPDGPERCSGLPVQRHNAASLGKLFERAFEPVEQSLEVHHTPTDVEQRFSWAVFRRH